MRAIKWENAPSVYVAFMDILGYKQILKNNDQEKIRQIYAYNIEGATLHNQLPYEIVHSTERFASLGGNRKASVKSVIVSDSVILWTTDDSMKSFVDLLFSVDMMMAESFLKGIPLRGAIDIGEVSWYFDGTRGQTVLTGKPIVEAYEAAETQNWAGCSISNRSIETYQQHEGRYTGDRESLFDIGYMLSSKLLLKYPIPLKFGAIKNCWVPNWTACQQWSNYFGRKDIRARSMEHIVRWAFSALGKDATDWSVETKIRNTLEFLEKGLGHDIRDENWPPEPMLAPIWG